MIVEQISGQSRPKQKKVLSWILRNVLDLHQNGIELLSSNMSDKLMFKHICCSDKQEATELRMGQANAELQTIREEMQHGDDALTKLQTAYEKHK